MTRKYPKTPEEMYKKYEDKAPFFADYFEHKIRSDVAELGSKYLEDYTRFRWEVVQFVRERFGGRPNIEGGILVTIQNAISELASKWNRRISMGDKIAYLAKTCTKLGTLYRAGILNDDDIRAIADFLARYGVDRDMFIRMFNSLTGASVSA